MKENLIHHEPDNSDWDKFKKINALSEEEWERQCIACNDCTICRMAIHQQLYSTTKHTCTYGITEKEFTSCVDNANVIY